MHKWGEGGNVSFFLFLFFSLLLFLVFCFWFFFLGFFDFCFLVSLRFLERFYLLCTCFEKVKHVKNRVKPVTKSGLSWPCVYSNKQKLQCWLQCGWEAQNQVVLDTEKKNHKKRQKKMKRDPVVSFVSIAEITTVLLGTAGA